ncbi:apical endosomal glycoprotein isoform X1 [Gallus gallus]|uniref:apical endosomal glycoprotein isoform X1 n=1 Tax=Gallus gallus TaxID=9031 RepID=UPI001F01F518|nr:apical endosomal glycoprotein isoform X1 [Gallus gallus]
MASPGCCLSRLPSALLTSLLPVMSGLTLLLAMLLLAGAIPSSRAAAVNSCGSVAEHRCDFVCHCGDCSDENQCGYLGISAVLGSPFTCDFEDDDCGWRDVSTSTYRWVRGRASLDSWGTGPHSDHTMGTDQGWFMVTVSPPAKATATAWLQSPVMQEATATCEIWASYHLSGSGLNQTACPTLRLAVAFGDTVVELWRSPEHRAEGWHQLVAYPGRIKGQFQLTFALTQPPACGAVLALDDIVFRNCGLLAAGQQSCGAEESSCSRGSCLALGRFCDGTDDCGDGSDEDAEQCQFFTFCSFEEDLCSWEVEAGQPTWERNTSVGLGTTSGVPTRDHSTNSATGYFLHTVAGGAVSVARLSSPTFQATNSCSLVLYCHLHGSATSSLRISYVINSTEHLVRERTGDTGSCWVRERVDFNLKESFKVLITGEAGSGGSVAVDDLILSPGCVLQQVPHSSLGLLASDSAPVALPGRARASNCVAEEFSCDDGGCVSAELVCDFAKACADGSDENHCGTTTFEEGAGGWHDTSVGQLRWAVQRATEPTATALVGAGAFLALQRGEGQMVAPAKARTPLLGPSGLACAMEMSYRLHSGAQGFLAVAVTEHSTDMTHLAWHTRGHGSTAWEHVHIPLGERARPFQVELLGMAELQDPEAIAIANVTFVQCNPGVEPPEAAELSCNFEADLCGWYPDRGSDFQWVRSTGQGQGSDHTTGSGYFLAVDPSAPWSRGQHAQLITYRQEPAAAPQCLAFWYRLAGPQIGTLSLKLQLQGAEETVLWTQRGSQGSVWHRGLATLPATGQQRYRLAFEALRDGFVGDMALDDVALTPGACGAELSCSFEAGACGLAGSGQWHWQSGGTGTGPMADHTTGTTTGHYMVVNTSKHSLPMGHVATLSSALYQRSAPAQCLAFWYQLSAAAPGTLSILVEENGEQRKLFSISAMEGDTWHRGHVTVRADTDWKVVFEAVGAGSERSYMALDDLRVSDGACPEPASCDFEWDTCGWSSPSDERLHGFTWGWKSGVPLAKYPGPEQDHTLGTEDGHYVHFDTRVLGAGGTAARLESQHLPATTAGCLRFWYHMDIPEHLTGGELQVKLQSAAGQHTAWSVAGQRSQGWQSSTVPLESPSEFQIVFEITSRMWPMDGTVALDDIEYSATGGCDSNLEAPGKVKSSSSFVAEVVVGLLLAVIVLALVAAGGRYWLKRRAQESGMAMESNTPQGFDNITFQDDKVIIAQVPKERDED